MKFLSKMEEMLKQDGLETLAAKLPAIAKPGVLLRKRYETIATDRAPLFGLFKRSPRQSRRGLAATPGASKLGGLPEMAEDQSWPTHQGEPMQFLAQINCTELNPFRDATLLPDSGMLHFFQSDYGMECRVTLTRDTGLKTIPAPSNAPPSNFVLPQFPVEFELIPTIPDSEMREFESLGLNDEDAEALIEVHSELIEKIRREQHGLHQVGGYPELIQGNVFTECEKDAGGEKRTWRQAAEHAHHWRLLLQFDTDGDLEVMWGDAGTIYFCIREDDLRAGRFDKVCSIMQCG
ncbi:MAG TPA: YwqG family protein [Verrucomicrobiae bacterium]|nr:YwqG family protein [Verrucomicrobiae bacterium]